MFWKNLFGLAASTWAVKQILELDSKPKGPDAGDIMGEPRPRKKPEYKSNPLPCPPADSGTLPLP